MARKQRNIVKQEEAAPRKVGRPPYVYDPEVLTLMDTVPAPFTVTQICETLGIGTHVFYRWLGEEKEFSEAVKRVRAMADDQVVHAFFNRATGYDKLTFEEKLAKDGQVQSLSKQHHIPAEPGAALNWLKNRDPENWTDKRQIEVTGSFADLVEKYAQELDESGE